MIRRLRKVGRRSGTVDYSEAHNEYPNMKGTWIEFPTKSNYFVVLEALEGKTDSLFKFYIADADSTPLPNYGNPHIVMDVPADTVESIVTGGTAKGKCIESMIQAAEDHNWRPIIPQGSHQIEPTVIVTCEAGSDAAQKDED